MRALTCRGSSTTAALVATLAAIAYAGAGNAADVPVPGKVAVVKPALLAKVVAKSIAPATFPLPVSGSADDPTLSGATLAVFDTLGVGAGTVAFTLDASGWQALGNPPGSKGYKYKGSADALDPDPSGTCRIVLIKANVLKAVCKGAAVTLAPPFTGNAAAVLDAGALRYCASFGGTTKKNAPGLFKRKDAPPPGSCPLPPSMATPTPTATPTATPGTGSICCESSTVDGPICLTAPAFVCSGPFVPGAPGDVCDGATGTCGPPPASVGNCCQPTGALLCSAGPGMTATQCSLAGGTSVPGTTCLIGVGCGAP